MDNWLDFRKNTWATDMELLFMEILKSMALEKTKFIIQAE